ncbi:Nn.00g000870.m01.CDS01 [Neocucurbitaria sp. VM-36]
MSPAVERDNRNSQAGLTAPHDRSSTVLHMRLKNFNLSTTRTSYVSRRASQYSTDNIQLPIEQHKTTILDLPVELIRAICDFSTLASRACLALTCHQLHHYIGTRVFTDLDYNNTRLEKAAFLQKLQKDRPNPELWLCYACLRYHSATQRYEPSNFRAVPGKDKVGFPYCKSIYAKALDEIYARLEVPRSEWTMQGHWMEDDITSPVQMNVYISCLADATDLMMRRRYRFNCRYVVSEFRQTPELMAVATLLDSLGQSDLEICPHICFAKSWWRGDGSIMSALQILEEGDHLSQGHDPMFQCAECRLDVEVQFLSENGQVVVSVWQHVGRLAYPADQGDGVGGQRVSEMEQSVPVERKQTKLLPLLTNSRSKLRTSSLLRLPKLAGSWTRTLGGLKRSMTEAAKVPMSAPESESAPARLPLHPGEMKRRWESLGETVIAQDWEHWVIASKPALAPLEARK